jgi:uncharacterized membrane protein YphA (DoxX/SURF4 family)
MIPLGIRLYGLGAIATGLVGLVWGDFALQWEPVAASFPGRTALAYAFAALLVAAGAAVNWRRSSAVLGAAGLVCLYVVVVVFMHGAQIVQHAGAFAAWDGAAEQVALLAGGVAAYAYFAGGHALASRVALILMGVCLLMFGLAHFLYLDFTAAFVPAWLPGGQKFWAVLTGVAHLAAGAALLSGIQARLAAVLLTVMFATFSVLVHLPSLIADPHSHLNWVMNVINLALTGAAWAVTTTLAETNTRREPFAPREQLTRRDKLARHEKLAAGAADPNCAGSTIRQGQES